MTNKSLLQLPEKKHISTLPSANNDVYDQVLL